MDLCYSDLDDILSQFEFIGLTKDDYHNGKLLIKNLDFIKITHKFYVIDECEIENIQYLIICTDFHVIKIKLNQLYLIKNLFINNNFIIFIFDDEIIEKFNNNINKKDDCIQSDDKHLNLKFNFNTEEIQNKLVEINSLIKLMKPQNHPIAGQWEVFQRPIFTYIIFHILLSSQYDRIFQYKNYFTKGKEIVIDKNDYIELKLLGIGSSSTVKLIFYVKRKWIFALKYSNKNDDESFKLFNREKNNYKKLQHPFLLKYYGELKSNYFNGLILEYIDGNSLNDIKKLSIEFSEKIKIIFQILVVFEFIHYHKCIYRDLKPDNIILNKFKNPILIDLGRLIELQDNQNLENITVNFFSIYVPPEINEINKISFKHDVYSIGLLIMFILFEEEPEIIIEYDKSEVILKNPNIFNYLPENYSKIREICQNCINYDPTKRPNVSQLVNDFYFLLFSKIPARLTEVKDIISIEKKHSIKLFPYWFLCSESNNSNYLYEFALYFKENNFIPENINKMLYYLKTSAKLQNDKAQFLLGLIYYEGKIVKLKPNKAISYFELSSYQNNSDAVFYLGKIYYDNIYVKRDIVKATYYFSLSSFQNNSEAQLYLGVIFYNIKNIKRSIYYFTLSANNNNSEAQKCLGSIYYEGIYVCKDIKKALYYAHLSAAQNNPSGIRLLGKIYQEDDINNAIYYLTLSAQQNCLESMLDLGYIYLRGIYCRRDIEKAFYYFTLASKQEKFNSYCLLGIIYYEFGDAQKNISKIIEYFTISANENNDEAQLYLGMIYFENIYVKRDINKSIKYLTRSANNNNDNARSMLGYIYYEAHYNPRDVDKAIYYLNISANNGDPQAQWYLGYIYHYGKYIKKDIKKAIYYYTLSAKNNLNLAHSSLGILYIKGDEVPKNIKLGIYHLEQGAITKEPISLHILGVIYYNGKYLKKNVNKAIYYLTLAANQNDVNSQKSLGYIYYKNGNIEKSIYYYKQAGDNLSTSSLFRLGCIYFDNKVIKQNIDNAIFYFKKASFKSFRAKNNLGVILKNRNSIQYAIELFNEAISMSNDEASIYNLVHLYFFNYKGCFNFNQCINLLLRSSNKTYYSLYLIALLFIQKYKNVTLEIIENNFMIENNKNIALEIYNLIIDDNLEKLYDIYYFNIQQINLVYNFNRELITYSQNDDFQENKFKIKEKKGASNITKEFYEGFNII